CQQLRDDRIVAALARLKRRHKIRAGAAFVGDGSPEHIAPRLEVFRKAGQPRLEALDWLSDYSSSSS
ncbi:MAG: hypothetical protein M3448_08520, partial [Pseudomonadota bacterium]|nr:hypothetical protein [Pseudomonadota bacterium]